MRAGDALLHAAQRLSAAGVDGARREARLLLAESAGLTAASLLTDPGQQVDGIALDALVSRRVAREPLALIVGWQEFWSLRFEVSRDTLIPRADSETLIEAALKEARGVQRVLDLGTGTGCLLLAALTEFPHAWGAGVDSSERAVGLARRNARGLGLAGRTAFVCSDWAAAVGPARVASARSPEPGLPRQGETLGVDRSSSFDLVLCNPPYIETSDLAHLMPEVATYEPARALDGGPDGMAAYRQILPQVCRLLSPDGIAVFELGQGQQEQVGALAASCSLSVRTVRADLAGIPRALVLEHR